MTMLALGLVPLLVSVQLCSALDTTGPHTHNLKLRNPSTGPSIAPMGRYHKAAVAADNVLCSNIGRDVLIAGGNAVDAAVATGFCIGVVNPHSCGIGGGHFATIYHRYSNHSSLVCLRLQRVIWVHSYKFSIETRFKFRKKKTCTVINAREMAPKASSENMFKGTTDSQSGWKASGVPGELAGFWTAYKKFGSGKIRWPELVLPTVRLLKTGYPVSEGLAHALQDKRKEIMAEKTMQIFVDKETGDVYKAGDIMMRPKFAEMLERIAYASRPMKEFYHTLGFVMAAENRKNGGIITHWDFEKFKVKQGDVIYTNLDKSGLKICGPPPPCSSAASQMIIKTMDEYGIIPSKVSQDVDYQADVTHYMLEAMKYAYAARSSMGDTKKSVTIARNITSNAYIKDFLQNVIKGQALKTASDYGIQTTAPKDGGTSHIAVIDEDGNAVSVTSTINTYFGAIRRSEETGMIWNNEMDDFSTPGLNNAWGFPPSAENYIKPGKRPFSSIAPLVIFNPKTGNVELVVGSEGGSRIISTVAQVAIRSLMFNSTIKEAMDARRIHNQLGPFHSDAETGFPEAVLKVLNSDYGQDIEERPLVLTVAATAIRRRNDLLYATADFRKGSSSSPAGY